ncbi:membrane protein [Bacteroidia bacterium]|nr:membrane protein [Bacteroidia bacterium]
MIQKALKKWGKHLLAVAIFALLSLIYFAPSVLEDKYPHLNDEVLFLGMGGSQSEKFAKTAQPGEVSVWGDAMFSGMPYVSGGYGTVAPSLPSYLVVGRLLSGWCLDRNASIVFAGLLCFYILMCVLGVNWWLAIAGAIAFAFASYNLIIIEAGHINKAFVIAYMPITLAGLALLFRREHLWGSILFLLGVALSISNGHVQITYYLVLLCLFIYLAFLIAKIKEKEFQELGKTTAIMAVCVLVAVLPNAGNMYYQWDLGKSSIRGATELTTTTTASGEQISSGLDIDYAFQWSYGRSELLTFLIPNVYGGQSGNTLDKSSEFYQTLRKAGYQLGKEVQAPTYWGDKPFTSGAVYFGAIVCFLFVLGMFTLKSRMKWGLFAGAAFLTLLALGRNMEWLNVFLFHNLPMYNKFRTPEMALVIPGLVFPVIAFWGLKNIIEEKVARQELKKGLIWSLSITGGICLLIWWFPNAFFSFQSNYDAQYEQQPWYGALLNDRATLASADAFRSLVFVVLGAGLVYLFTQMKNKQKSTLILGVGIAVLTFIDLWTVDKRYLNYKDFVKAPTAIIQDNYKLSVADEEILSDTDDSFRVVTLNNPFQETTVSYYHHSVGGYFAAKLRRYQELIDHRLSGELNMITQSLKKQGATVNDIQQTLASVPSLNMLNTRYIIYNPEQPPLRNPFAFGNAWFVSNVSVVENADAEIEALNAIDPSKTAVVDKRFADELNGFTPQPDTVATIVLANYRPSHLTYTSKSTTEQLAVFSEIYYQPGWTAKIDGNPAPHFRADWVLRAMRIPAGEHTIEFKFYPTGYVVAGNIGVYSSFFMLLLLIFGIGYSGWRMIKKEIQAKKI